MSTNIFISILRELHVPFTKGAALRAYEDHPYKYTFYGLKSLCEIYGIYFSFLSSINTIQQ